MQINNSHKTEFNFSLEKLFNTKSGAVVVLDKQRLEQCSREQRKQIEEVVTAMAQGSRIAQGLQQSVTSMDFIVNHYHTLILLI